MSTRISSALILPLVLAACGGPAKQAGVAAGERIDCAVDGEAAFHRSCTVARTGGADGLVLVVNNPDGGFHRLAVTQDGRGVIAADGAEPARVTLLAPNMIEVAIGGDRYHLPAHLKGSETQ